MPKIISMDVAYLTLYHINTSIGHKILVELAKNCLPAAGHDPGTSTWVDDHRSTEPPAWQGCLSVVSLLKGISQLSHLSLK